MGVPRRALLGAGLALPLAACGTDEDRPARSSALRQVTVLTGFGYLGQDAFMVTSVARELFADVGLKIKLVPGAGTAGNLKLLVAGRADFAILDPAGAAQSWSAGLNRFKIFAAIYQGTVSAVMARAGTGINRPADLAGRTIAYSPGGVNKTLFPVYAKLANLDDSTIRWVSVEPRQIRAPLAAGRVDAIFETVIGKPGTEAAIRGPAVVLPYGDYLSDLYGNCFAATDTTLGRDRDLVRRFRSAAVDALQWAIDNPDQAGRDFKAFNKGYAGQRGAEVAAAETRLMIPYVRGDAPVGSLSPNRVARAVAILQGSGAIPAVIPPDKLVAFDLAATGPTPT